MKPAIAIGVLGTVGIGAALALVASKAHAADDRGPPIGGDENAREPKPDTGTKPATEVGDLSVKNAQTWLNALGAKLAVDGLYGPKTEQAWNTAAKNRKLAQGFARKDGSTASVPKATAVRIQADAKKALAKAQTEQKPKPVAPKPVAPAPVALAVKTAQTWLNALGAKLAVDGLYGPKTEQAWNAAAKNRKQAQGFARKDGSTANVDKATAARIEADAKKALAAKSKVSDEQALAEKLAREAAAKDAQALGTKPPAPKPVAPTPAAPKADITVKNAQTWLNALGAKLAVDGLYGPKTEQAWNTAAKNRGQGQGFTRKNQTTATVAKTASDRIQADAKAALAKVPPAPKPPAPKPATPPAPAVITAEISVKEAQGILNDLGAGLTADGLYGPRTQTAWDAAAKNRGQKIGFTKKSANSAIIVKGTYNKLLADSIVAKAKRETQTAQTATPKPAAVAGAETVVTKVLEVQRALNRQGYGLKEDGLYGPNTMAAWQKLTAQLKLSPRFEKVDANRVRIDSESARTIDKLPAKPPAKTAAPAGYDKTKAKAQAKDVAAMLAKSGKAYDKTRLGTWQRYAGIKADGLYGPLSKSALEYFGAKPPAAFVAGSATKYQPPA